MTSFLGFIGGVVSLLVLIFFFILVARVGSLLDYSKAILKEMREIRSALENKPKS